MKTEKNNNVKKSRSDLDNNPRNPNTKLMVIEAFYALDPTLSFVRIKKYLQDTYNVMPTRMTPKNAILSLAEEGFLRQKAKRGAHHTKIIMSRSFIFDRKKFEATQPKKAEMVQKQLQKKPVEVAKMFASGPLSDDECSGLEKKEPAKERGLKRKHEDVVSEDDDTENEGAERVREIVKIVSDLLTNSSEADAPTPKRIPEPIDAKRKVLCMRRATFQ